MTKFALAWESTELAEIQDEVILHWNRNQIVIIARDDLRKLSGN